jgi:hypothetical protein
LLHTLKEKQHEPHSRPADLGFPQGTNKLKESIKVIVRIRALTFIIGLLVGMFLDEEIQLFRQLWLKN